MAWDCLDVRVKGFRVYGLGLPTQDSAGLLWSTLPSHPSSFLLKQLVSICM